jgi:hypothetical protein
MAAQARSAISFFLSFSHLLKNHRMKQLFTKKNAVLAIGAALLVSNFTYATNAHRAVSGKVATPSYANGRIAASNASTPALATVVAVAEAVAAVSESVAATAAAYIALRAAGGFPTPQEPVQSVRLARLD